MLSTQESQYFVDTLLAWSRANPREMPWVDEDDPYRIWLSEIILQQTQVVQGIPYYHKFISKYPTVADLARTSEGEILKDWQGLGYNSRARNMLRAAQQVVADYGGNFPDTQNELLNLSGIGPYTAAAVASFAFGERVAVMDSNVIRVLCRFLGITDHPGSTAIRKTLRDTLESLIAYADPAAFNQGLMNFGALCCKPKNPTCHQCPFASDCLAYNTDLVGEIPVKPVRKKRSSRYLHYFIFFDGRGLLLRHRTDRDIWRGMYDFPLIETDGPALLRASQRKNFLECVDPGDVISERRVVQDRQTLTHRHIHARFYAYEIDDLVYPGPDSEYRFVDYKNLRSFAFPKIVDCYLRANLIHL